MGAMCEVSKRTIDGTISINEKKIPYEKIWADNIL